MNPNLRDRVVLLAVQRRKKEYEMQKLRSNFCGSNVLDIIKEEWLQIVSLENQAIDALVEDEKK